MDRLITYPNALALDTDPANIQRNVMIALGMLVKDVIGTGTVFGGLAVGPTAPASMSVSVAPGSIYQLSTVDATAFGSLAADTTDALMKVGVNIAATSIALTAPSTSGQSINYLIEASLVEADGTPITLPYYDAADPAVSWSGVGGTGGTQNTTRTQRVQLQAKAGTAATTGSQTTPSPDSGWIGIAVVTVAYAATSIVSGNIAAYVPAPVIPFTLATLRPGFASGVQTFTANGSFTVPQGVSQVEVEVWGGGAGSYASTASIQSGGGSGGGYARKRITGLTAGSVIAVTVGAGGTAGNTSGPTSPTAGGTSSFGSYVSATGGSLNTLANTGAPALGGTPAGTGSGGDVNMYGSDGENGGSGQGGLGGAGANGGGSRSVASSIGNAGYFPGGGASGAGTTSGANNGAAGAGGLVVVRW